ncbi:MAG: response regulator [Dehalococcoidia bacterium]|nr:response regulator [Dehalococcoidia bacterium]
MPQILVIDDDIAMRELLYDALTRKGHQVATANAGSQALEMLKTLQPVLIFVDAAMPGLGGLQTIRQIREFDDAVGIVLLSAPGEPAVPDEELRKLGVWDVLRKELGVELFLKGLDLSLKRLSETAASAKAPKPRVPGTLLVVDDEPKIQKLLKACFESRGLRVVVAGSGEEALAALKHKPLAVLLDVNMGGMDGLMTLRKIRAQEPELPVIMASAVGEEATVKEALAAGAYDYVTKPFNLEYLETVVLTKILLGMEG